MAAFLWFANRHFVTNLTDTSCVVLYPETHHIYSWFSILMEWILIIGIMAIAKGPMVGYDVMLTRRVAEEINIIGSWIEIPGENSMAAGGFTLYSDLVAYITDATF